MKHLPGVALLLLALLVPLAGAQPRSERRVAYRIEATLDPATRTIHGRQQVSWRNPDRVPVSEIQFHLYLNAFRDARSTFMRESGGVHRGFRAGGSGATGGIDVRRLQLVTPGSAPVDLTARMRFIQPDDGNPDDRTVVAVALPRPVAPGATLRLDFTFEARLPRVVARTGWSEKPDGRLFFMGAQWFPKLGVYEPPGHRYVPADAPRGAWNTHQAHLNTEYYADFGTYDVALTLPEGYTVGATGRLVAERAGGGTRTLTFRADDVHDFAWAAADDFVALGDRWRHVEIRLLLQPEHRGQARRFFESARLALEQFDRRVGPYPYSTLTLVDAPGGAAGMEYPTLITVGTQYGVPGRIRIPEAVTIHEFGHQYFYGILASNEFEEAWLDEGITSYLEWRVMDEAYPGGSMVDFPGLRLDACAIGRLSYTKQQPNRGAIVGNAWEVPTFAEYGKLAYYKPAALLVTLEHHLGQAVMQRILRAYYDRWAFRHPTTRDFIAVAEAEAGRRLDWFFGPYLYGTAVVDYAVEEIANPPAGGRVTVTRRQDGVFPQLMRVRFADGSATSIRWDGAEARRTFAFTRPVAEAWIDPFHHVPLDVDRLNNRRAADADPVFARKWQLKVLVWLQQLFYLVAALG